MARVAYETSYGGIQRIDTERVITITSNVLSGYNANFRLNYDVILILFILFRFDGPGL